MTTRTAPVAKFISKNFPAPRHYSTVNSCIKLKIEGDSSQWKSKTGMGFGSDPKGEVQASAELSARGFEAFLPTRPVRRQWSGSSKDLEVPVFPGYIFCRFHLGERIRVLDAPAVIQVLGIGGTPTPSSDAEIATIQTMVISRLVLTPWPYLHSGQRKDRPRTARRHRRDRRQVGGW